MTTRANVLDPWVPSAKDPFDLRRAGHLLRRAGYSGSLALRRELVRNGLAAALRRVFGEDDTAPDLGQSFFEDARALGAIERVREFRVWLALSGSRPLQQRTTAFWHAHFATSNKKIADPATMLRQFATFDRLGLGTFDALAQAMARDPALLRFLDNDTNGKDHPNENFAREWFELFTLGRGNYSERDIREAARAFTGFFVSRGEFALVSREHDKGEKEILGQRGALDGGDVAQLAVEHAASARFLAAKWLRWFVHPEPEAPWIDALAQCYADNGRHIGKTLRVLLQSQLFFGEQAYRSKIKSPAELLIGTVRSLDARIPPKLLAQAMVEQGEAWGEPPTVEGWHGERAWLSPATWLLRSNAIAEWFAGKAGSAPQVDSAFARAKTPGDRAQTAILLLLDGAVSVDSRARLVAFASAQPAEPTANLALLHAAANLPEYQLL